MKTIDEKIRHLVQSEEKEIPSKVEATFMEKLNRSASRTETLKRKPGLILQYLLASAACLLIASLLFIHRTDHHFSKNPAEEILIQSAKIEGQTARTIIFKEQNPEFTVVWVEK